VTGDRAAPLNEQHPIGLPPALNHMQKIDKAFLAQSNSFCIRTALWAFVAIGLSLTLGATTGVAQSGDTLSISFPQAEEIFLHKNFQLLAQQFNIRAADGAMRQARLWNNPLLFVETNAYNPTNKKLFGLGETPFKWYDGTALQGQLQVQVNQLFLLAGKRSKLVELAKTNRDIQAKAFDDMMRCLHFELYQAFVALYYDQQSIGILQEEERQLTRLIRIELIALDKGAISGYEVTRLQFELQDIRKSIKEYLDQIAEDENNLKLLLSAEPNVHYRPLWQERPQPAPTLVEQLIDSALFNRPEVELSGLAVNFNRTNIQLQKAYAIPDLNLGANYDRSGNAWYNYSGINMAFTLPLFNRNQGNIKVAQQQFQQSELLQQQTTLRIKQEVIMAFQKLQNSLIQKRSIDPRYEENLKNLSQTATDKYNERIISLLDFLDKIKTARLAQINLYSAYESLALSEEYVNFVTNARVFP
jgi:cobalt-zinc-cadmium efflux system outer membrane protein